MSKNTLARRLMASLEGSNIGVPPAPVVPGPTPEEVLIENAQHEGEIDELQTQLDETDQQVDPDGMVDNDEPAVESLDGLDSTDMMSGGIGVQAKVDVIPENEEEHYATREELFQHVAVDQAEHQRIQAQINQLKSVSHVGSDVAQITEAVTAMEGLTEGDLVFANIALESLSKHPLAPAPIPTLQVMDGRPSKVSLEAVSSWVERLYSSTTVDNSAVQSIRKPETDASFMSRAKALQKALNSVSELATGPVTLSDEETFGLMVDGKLTTDLKTHLAALATVTCKVTEIASENYAQWTTQMATALEAISKVNSNEALEEALKVVAGVGPDFELFVKLEDGTTPYLNNFRFKASASTPVSSIPGWFLPVMELATRPGYEPEQLKSTPPESVPALPLEECKAVVEQVIFILTTLSKAEAVYKEHLQTMQKHATEAIRSLTENMPVMDTDQILPVNVRMINTAVVAISSAQQSAYGTISPFHSLLNNSLYAALSLVVLSCGNL